MDKACQRVAERLRRLEVQLAQRRRAGCPAIDHACNCAVPGLLSSADARTPSRFLCDRSLEPLAWLISVIALWLGEPYVNSAHHRARVRRSVVETSLLSTGRNMVAQIVGAHGIAQQQKGRNQLIDAWLPALLDGLERSAGQVVPAPSFQLAFYGDLFLPADSGPRTKGRLEDRLEDVDASELDFLDEAADEAIAGAPAEAMRPADKGAPRVPALMQPIMRKLARRFDGKSALLFVHALRQVRLYVLDDALASQVRDRVRAGIADDCRVLIGHSLGSVAAFEVLALDPELPVQTLVTLGSPLGIRTVHSRLRGSPGPAGRRSSRAGSISTTRATLWPARASSIRCGQSSRIAPSLTRASRTRWSATWPSGLRAMRCCPGLPDAWRPTLSTSGAGAS